MFDRYITTVDLGSSKLALSVARVSDGATEIIYYREYKSEGIKAGGIYNPTRTAGVLREAVGQAQKELNISIHSAVVNLPLAGIRQESRPAGTVREDPSSCITREEIEALRNAAVKDYPLEDEKKETIYRTVAQSFSTDEMIRASEEDIEGMPSEKLDCNFKVFIGPKRSVDNIENAFSQAGISVSAKYFCPEILAESILTEDEKDNGVGLVEMGGGVTSLTIYQGKLLRFYGAVPFGGKSITTDIKTEGAFNEALAENIKLAYGACQPDRLLNMSEKVIKILNDEDGLDQEITVKYLSEIISARVLEIFHSILFLLNESGYGSKLRSGLVLTGGGANLTNCVSYLRDLSGMNVRTGFPKLKRISSVDCAGLGETEAALTVGMVLTAAKDKRINCSDPYEVSKREFREMVREPEPAYEPEPVYEEVRETVVEVTEEAKEETAGPGRDGKVKWGEAIKQKLDKVLFDGILGKMYDEMEEEQ